MKFLIGVGFSTKPTFDASAKTVTFNSADFSRYNDNTFVLIINNTRNKIIYNMTQPATHGATNWDAASGVLTLKYDTTGMSDTDELQVWWDSKQGGPDMDFISDMYMKSQQTELVQSVREVRESNMLVVGAMDKNNQKLDKLGEVPDTTVITANASGGADKNLVVVKDAAGKNAEIHVVDHPATTATHGDAATKVTDGALITSVKAVENPSTKVTLKEGGVSGTVKVDAYDLSLADTIDSKADFGKVEAGGGKVQITAVKAFDDLPAPTDWLIDCGSAGSVTVDCGSGNDAGFTNGGTVSYGSLDCTTTTSSC